METPTSFLPPIKRLDEYPAPQIHDILTRLVTLYLPEVRGTAPIDENLESLQADTFERSFTIRWLTGFIARGEEWVESFTHDSEETSDPTVPSPTTSSVGRFQTSFAHDTYQARSTAFDRAAALLGACAGTSASGAISREFKFPTSNDEEVTITLRDESISTGDHTAVGLQTWGSACILAERIARDPASFGIPTSTSGAQETRILELGAGTGLLSLLFGKLAKQDQCTIVATDYHSAVLDNLRANVQANFQTAEPPVQVEALDWSLYLTGKPTTNLSRAPSTAVTPAIGTPIAVAPTPPTLSSAPSLVSSSALSTPGTPRTPQTPRTVRSPPPNLARAVFSRLIARGEEFDMPGTEPGEEAGVKGPSEHIKSPDEQIRNPEVISARPRSTVDPEPTNYASAVSPPTTENPCLGPAVPSSPSVPVSVAQDQVAKITPEPGALLCAGGARRQCLIPHPDDTHCSELSGEQQLPRHLDMSNEVAFLDSLDADGTHAVQAPQVNRSARIFFNSDPNVKDRVANELVGLCPAPNSCPGLMANTGLTSTKLEGEAGSTANKALGLNGELAPEGGENFVESSLINRNLISQIPAFEDTRGRDKSTTMSTSFDHPFDTIFGADIVYELSHVNLVRGVVERLLRKPSHSSSAPPAFFHLIMPLRPTHIDEASSVDMAFPRAEDVRGSSSRNGQEALAIVATETYARSAGVGRADEVQYVHYKVGWV